MEEYKTIAKRVLVPSFFSLLAAGSTIFLAYSFLFDSQLQKAIGILCLFISMLALFFYMRHISAGFQQNEREEENSLHVDVAGENISFFKRNPPGFFYHLAIPLLVSLVIVIRILILNQHLPIGNNSVKFTGLAESVKSQRYSNEIAISFRDYENIGAGFHSAANMAISYADKDIKINPGDELVISSKPREIKTDKNNISPFEKDLVRRGFHYFFYLNSKNFKIIKSAPISLKDRIRNIIEDNFRKLFDEKTIPVLKGLYFANGSYIDKSTTADFKRAGVLHILAASGEHIGIIAAALLILFNPLLINRKIIRVIISVILFFYLYITDMPVSLLRAFVMYYVYSIQYLFDFDKNILNTLFISAIIILIIYPFELYSLGFQLSFGATFGIIVFYNFYKEALSFLPAKISGMMSVTFSAQVLVFPVIFAQLKEINLMGLLSNIILVFTMSVTLIVSLIANLMSVVSLHFAKYIAMITDTSYSVSLYIIRYFSGANGHFSVNNKGYLLIVPYILFLIPVIPAIKNKKVVLLSLIMSVICAWGILSSGYSSGKNKIAIYNNKDSVILVKDNNISILFGTLESMEGAETIVKYLNGNNIRNIILCIPIPDYRNIKSCAYLIKKTIVSECIISPDFMFTGHFKKFCQTLDTDGINLRISKFENIEAGKLLTEYNSRYIKNIFEAPLMNISRIHNLLTRNYDLKNSVMKDIAGNGYEIEYME